MWQSGGETIVPRGTIVVSTPILGLRFLGVIPFPGILILERWVVFGGAVAFGLQKLALREILRDLAEQQLTVGAFGQGNWGAPSYGGGNPLLDRNGITAGGHDREPAAGGQEEESGRHGAGHVVDRAQGDAVEACGEGFRAGRMDGCHEAKSSDGFAEESRFLVLGFSERDGYLVAKEGDGNTREACSGAEIQ